MALKSQKIADKEVAVLCTGVTKVFKSDVVETHALRGVDLEIHKGEFFMLVGPSGCGKTTLISIIAGILQQTQGKCVVEKHDFATMTAYDLLNFRSKHVGFIFQSFNLIPTLTVLENVTVPLIIQGTSRDQAAKVGITMLERVGLEGRADSSVNQLSGGQQQRVAIARSLIHNPSILICDEPTSALDHETGEKIIALMQEINRANKTTFVIVTHDNRIFKYADRIAHMDDGRVTHVTNSGEY